MPDPAAIALEWEEPAGVVGVTEHRNVNVISRSGNEARELGMEERAREEPLVALDHGPSVLQLRRELGGGKNTNICHAGRFLRTRPAAKAPRSRTSPVRGSRARQANCTVRR